MCVFLLIKMSNITNIIKDIESSLYSVDEIVKKYEITKYKYYQILKEADIKNSHPKKGPAGVPKNTKFKQLLNEGKNENIDETSFDMEGFKNDCIDGVKLSELMEKYKLSLYQVRELRKKYELKTR